jgi:hypothetical protein
MIHAARFTDKISNHSEPLDRLHATRNFELWRALNTGALKAVLDSMVASGDMHRQQAEAFQAQADGLLALLLSENNRSMGF